MTKCGVCTFAKQSEVDPSQLVCYYNPPHVQIVIPTANKIALAGKSNITGFQVQYGRPPVLPNDGCALGEEATT